ncbi:hypothetical protein B9Z55_009068 [Caenorhabditis nigoni]|uniref:Uncharacterized protein n=1 Tax=Caenorhabditis nigoni TaxID=1611254 RepID=A0A2G5UQE7_9PELO|nr:hypothetical protein B9Z55_009068 [Caenorhabditis nigoni]
MSVRSIYLQLLFVLVISANVTIVPEWVLLSYCGECRYCLALKGWEQPYFCVLDEKDIPCYIRLEFFPDLLDGCEKRSDLDLDMESSSPLDKRSSSDSLTNTNSIDRLELLVVVIFLLCLVLLELLLCIVYKLFS